VHWQISLVAIHGAQHLVQLKSFKFVADEFVIGQIDLFLIGPEIYRHFLCYSLSDTLHAFEIKSPCSSADPSKGRMVGSKITIMNLSSIDLIGKF
jgi:hypothetical protein